jgi:CBS domain-containing protein
MAREQCWAESPTLLSSLTSSDMNQPPEENGIKFVRDLMTIGVETCSPDTPIVEIVRAMLINQLDEIVVLEEGNALGVVGQKELIRAYASDDFRSLVAEDVMREGIPQAPPEIPLAAAAQVMLDLDVRTLFLMHQSAGIEYPAALISFRHLLRHMLAENVDELRDLGIKAERRLPLETFIERRDAARKNLKS